MKKLLTAICLLATYCLQAQQNVFLDQAFWKTNPTVATVQAEIDNGNDPAQPNRMNMDAVALAINAQAPNETIKFLLSQKGNEVTKLLHDGRTYLFLAASRGNTEMMVYLLEKGAKMDVQDSHGFTVINYAAVSRQTDTKVFDICIAHGSDPKKERNHDGANALLLAVGNDKDLKLTDYFISKGVDINSTDDNGNTAFNYAARGGNIDIMNALLKRGVKYNDNAMIMAAQSGGGRGAAPNTLAVYQYLEGLKIKPNAINKNGENALHFIVRKPEQAEIIKYFISKGVDINQADNEGNTAFMNAAAANRDLATINLLLPEVKNINQQNKKAVSAFAMAVRSNSVDVTRLLIDKGADIKVVDADGNNLAYYLIQAYNANPNPMRGASSDFEPKMKLLSEKGFDLTMPQRNGNTLYHLAIAKDDLNLLRTIEPLKVDVNARNKEGMTVLHKAAMTAKSDAILKYLLSIGAKKDVVTDMKETAFDLAVENEYLSKNHISIDFLKL